MRPWVLLFMGVGVVLLRFSPSLFSWILDQQGSQSELQWWYIHICQSLNIASFLILAYLIVPVGSLIGGSADRLIVYVWILRVIRYDCFVDLAEKIVSGFFHTIKWGPDNINEVIHGWDWVGLGFALLLSVILTIRQSKNTVKIHPPKVIAGEDNPIGFKGEFSKIKK